MSVRGCAIAIWLIAATVVLWLGGLKPRIRCDMRECLASIFRGARVLPELNSLRANIATLPCIITSARRDAADSSGDGGVASKQAARSQSCAEHVSRFVQQAGQICNFVHMGPLPNLLTCVLVLTYSW